MNDLARAICVLAEALVSQKRVMVVGDSSLALHELVSNLGARIVHVYDPDSARAMAQPPPAARGTVLHGMPEGDFDVRDGAFDLAIVPDLASVHDAAALLARLRRVVGADGALLCAAENRDATNATNATSPANLAGSALDYYELYDLVSLQFAHVRMIAAMPFFGMTLAELGQDEVDSAVRVDAQLVTADRPPPSAFVALASQNDVAVDAYAVIETGEPPETAPKKLSTDTIPELAQARLHAAALTAQLEELAHAKSAHVRAEEEARRALDALDVERERAARLERELHLSRDQTRSLKEARDGTAEIAAALAQSQIRASALEEGVDLAEKTIVVQRERIVELESELAKKEDLALELAKKEELAAPSVVDEVDTTAEAKVLEEKLRDRGDRVAALEEELVRREKLVRELVARLDEASQAETVDPAIAAKLPELTAKLDELAVLAAHQRIELEARAWRIAELERSQEDATP